MFSGQKLYNWECSEIRRTVKRLVVVKRLPKRLMAHALGYFPQPLKDFTRNVMISSLSCSQKLSIVVDLLILAFFGRGELEVAEEEQRTSADPSLTAQPGHVRTTKEQDNHTVVGTNHMSTKIAARSGRADGRDCCTRL
ncbi:hypothetical protein J6590_099760 [Homalodisca vitripennis]|nr:hypothetical protein J6590_099760 [Homalodisca vitripennis]